MQFKKQGSPPILKAPLTLRRMIQNLSEARGRNNGNKELIENYRKSGVVKIWST